ncbi:MAG: GNAT family N-acetyltransferase [Gemmatimonadota bacterium]|nr:GNAT family N-acetyltransferase [Gemmatimonadota bacterium]
MMESVIRTPLLVRDLEHADLERVVYIDALHTGDRKPRYWERVFEDFLRDDPDRTRVGLAAQEDGRLIGYVLGEVRAFEFGSEACGWVFAVGVDPEQLREDVGSTLLAEICRRFRDAGIVTIRTMVRRNDVPVLSFFRANGFVGGPFVQLEVNLGKAS